MTHGLIHADLPAPAPRPTADDDIPFYDGSASFRRSWPDLRRHLDAVMDRGKYSHGQMVERLEARLCAYTGARFAIGCNSGTDALMILLRAAGVAPGDEVIVPCFTFVASATSVALIGARPVFVDVNPRTYDIDVAAARAAVTERTRAIMPVHLFHQMADMTALQALADDANLMIVEDSAEAIGMWYGGRHGGLFGRGGVLSFFPTKTLGALGDAGMILTDDASIVDEARVMRHHGRTGQTIDNMPGISNEAVVWGYNSKMDDIQAAVLMTRMATLDAEIARRAEIAGLYDRLLAPLDPRVRTPRVAARPEATNPVYYVYVIEAENKAGLMAHLAAHGIGTEEYYPRPLHRQPCFADLGYRAGDFPVAEDACTRTFALPLYPDLSDRAVERVCACISDFYDRSPA
ncbi:DegT/DnrJ/EryC1/StrS family aminotransferase [Roseospira visakhapatnamensis]|uniref:dTDP-4-amino-4,6-dideoxygalactose transaminase n=1 Tax=Roseospira visakhapatnamensis TaxID=390880 RepID=A0A7W6RA31_9PROT|nr:DegT/DnrJ/EryC1/StrS family aminotransferase [Roseospira visakhapatnamensis]MBB4264585.1 dTDP-4-amino-4,6-dideoxygalactose transaminase [Roseospira visakhapatnamensis]